VTLDAKVPSSAPSSAGHVERTTLLDRLTRSVVMRRFLDLNVIRRALSPARGNRAIHRFIRYSMVSGVAIVISQVAILICTAIFHFSGILANTVGAVAATPASYELNRKWAWGKRGKSHLWKEVTPFWALTLIGYLASTGTVQLADNMCASHHVTGLDRAFAIMGASLFAYGVVWVAKFIIFNKLVFGSTPAQAAGPAAYASVAGTAGPLAPGAPGRNGQASNGQARNGHSRDGQSRDGQAIEAVGALEAPGAQ